ncbi:MAG: hypothetical protein VX640_03140 [Pseudomonadota bacterium]|nr:hypothetical protein [Pseudomonadota bacterium]
MAERLIEPVLPATARKRAFIDLEASGLGSKSWPAEVGWAFEDGEAQSLLIRPHDSWTEEAWDEKAQALHGLTRARLETEGADPRAVCMTLNDAFEGVKVYSDAPDWDGFWLFRLFSAAGVRQNFTIFDYGRLIRPLLDARQGAILERAARLAPRRHRAAADARHLQVLYKLASENCAPRLTR